MFFLNKFFFQQNAEGQTFISDNLKKRFPSCVLGAACVLNVHLRINVQHLFRFRNEPT